MDIMSFMVKMFVNQVDHLSRKNSNQIFYYGIVNKK